MLGCRDLPAPDFHEEDPDSRPAGEEVPPFGMKVVNVNPVSWGSLYRKRVIVADRVVKTWVGWKHLYKILASTSCLLDLNMILRDLSAFNMGRGAYDTTGVKKPGVPPPPPK
ncbi:hypothetical protein DTO013E5_1675 [Penicillium roqueforti]|nr:hypothetical protein CBS147337_1049 [Penicillium roqueforti]KAI2678516.1 hypothetical protein CBS147355_4401 [Penicillium roqueforti]KAI2689319.1 hypothetical protein LCP963914a_2408 [Penicillium roqueforti]KAI2694624.1 hypothetical protein CBS147372_9706 [Penicillium roqueforti]KAI2713624.1 hypothetical protein CBS147332_5364 [Penicillium roqueforti]